MWCLARAKTTYCVVVPATVLGGLPSFRRLTAPDEGSRSLADAVAKAEYVPSPRGGLLGRTGSTLHGLELLRWPTVRAEVSNSASSAR